MTPNANIYAHARNQVAGEFRARLSGCEESLWLALVSRNTGQAARTAIAKSAESLGYGANGATFLDVSDASAVEAGATEGALGALSPDDFFRLVEGLDPICIVVADPAAAQLLANAYHVTLPDTAAVRVFGREVRLLPNLNQLVETPEGKQRAWAALKTLPRIGS